MDYFNEQWKNYQYTLMVEAIKRIRELHVPKPRYIGEDLPCVICNEILPCSTLKALGDN